MKKIDASIADFRFNESAVFFYLKKADDSSLKSEWRSFYEKCRDSENDDFSITNLICSKENNWNYIFFAFNKKKHPSFCVDNFSVFDEVKSCYVLFLYSKHKGALLSHNVSIPDKILNMLQLMEYDTFVQSKFDGNTKYRYLDMRNLDGSDNAIRSKSFVANDLKNNITSFSANQYYVQALRGDNAGKSFSINFGTSRLNSFLTKKTITDVVEWVGKAFEEFEIKKMDEDGALFLSSFAMRSKYNGIENRTPSSILLFWSDFESNLVSNAISLEEKDGDTFSVIELMNDFSNVGVLKKSNSEFIYTANFGNDVVKVSFLKNTIKLSCERWRKIKIKSESSDYDGRTIEYLVNRWRLFNVYFSESSEVYSNGCLFKNGRLTQSIERVLNCMATDFLGIEKVNCEKYENGTKLDMLNAWGAKSEFSWIINNFTAEYETLVCDDCGDEWADFIGINVDSVEFFACKYKEISKKKKISGLDSASKLHDVVNQSIKNLVNFYPTENQIEKKIEKCRGLYLSTGILMRVKGRKDLDIMKNWQKKAQQPNFRKISSLVINFISKRRFEKNVSELKKIVQSGEKQFDDIKECTFQQLCLLNSFVNSCLEMGVEPRIYCCN